MPKLAAFLIINYQQERVNADLSVEKVENHHPIMTFVNGLWNG
jgi:hypothetical protein